MLLKYFKQPIVRNIVLLTILISGLPFYSDNILKFFVTLSYLIKDIMLWVIPVVIIIFMSSSLISFKSRAPLLIVVILCFEFFSNFSSLVSATFFYKWAIPNCCNIPALDMKSLSPYFSLSQFKPGFWSSDKAVILGVILGISFIYYKPLHKFIDVLVIFRQKLNNFFCTFLSPLMPFFMMGFICNLYYSGLCGALSFSFAKIMLFMILGVFMYILWLFVFGAWFSFPLAFKRIRNAFSSLVMALMTMCSITTMPYTIACAQKNLKDPSLASMIIPATCNIQQVGDCFLNMLFCLVILQIFQGETPPIGLWLHFLVVYAFIRYATVSIMGGAIFITMPLYEQFFGYTLSMQAAHLALNVLFDPIVTATNVYGNGALCIIFEKFWKFVNSIGKRKRPLKEVSV